MGGVKDADVDPWHQNGSTLAVGVPGMLGGPQARGIIVAADVWQQEGDGFTTSNRFHAFPSAEVFFTEYLPRHGKRCYYEVPPADTQVKFYFDIEWV